MNPPSAVRRLVWSRTVDGELLVDEIKRVNLVLHQATRSQATWNQYAGDYWASDMATMAVIFRIISDWEGDLRFKTQAPEMSHRFSRAVSDEPPTSVSALSSARLLAAGLRDLVEGNGLGEAPSQVKPAGWRETVARLRLMERLQAAIEVCQAGGLQSPEQMIRRRQDLAREANVTTAIFAALCQVGCPDVDQSSYIAHCERALGPGLELRTAVVENRFESASQALSRLRHACTACHDEFR